MKNYSKLIRGGAIYDMVIALPFALPIIAQAYVQFLAGIHQQIGAGGLFSDIPDTGFFFINLFGCLVCLWSVLRILQPKNMIGFLDAVGRLSFSAIFLFYLLFRGQSDLLWLFFIPEFLLGVVQLWMFFRVTEANDRWTWEEGNG